MKHLFTISETIFVISAFVEKGDNVIEFISLLEDEFAHYKCSVSQNSGLKTKDGQDTIFRVYVDIKAEDVHDFERELNSFLKKYFKENFWLALKKEED